MVHYINELCRDLFLNTHCVKLVQKDSSLDSTSIHPCVLICSERNFISVN